MHGLSVKLNLIGEAALRILSDAQHGTVLACVTDATYFRSEKGELCWLIPSTGQMHPRAMQITVPLPRLNVGSAYQVVDHSFMTSAFNILDAQGAPVWTSLIETAADGVSRTWLNETLITIASRLLAQHVPSHLGDLIMPVIHLIDQQDAPVDIIHPNRFSEKAWLAIQGMVLASSAKDADGLIRSAKALIGFGEGLTPSGDDFLGGFFYSKWLLSHYFPHIMTGDRISTYSDFITQSKPLTNVISYTLLKDLDDGQAVESLQQLANGLLQGDDTDRLVLNAEQLIDVGRSTGWDLLTGFMTGMLTTLSTS